MGIVTRDACTSCHKTDIVNKDGYCEGCQKHIDWFFSEKNKTNKAIIPFHLKLKRYDEKKVTAFWELVFFFIFMLIMAIVISFAMDLF